MTIPLPPPDLSLPASTIEAFRTAIDTFGTFHPKSREWNLPLKLLLTEMGIEEARLLAWGDSVGMSGPPRLRVPPETELDIPSITSTFHNSLQSIVSLQASLSTTEAQKRSGIKQYAQTRFTEPALDTARYEAYIERQRRLRSISHKGRHLDHWTIVDAEKFRAEYVVQVRNTVSSLIQLTSDDEFIKAAILQDIKALAWHPVFEQHKASHDSQKLQMIRQSCGQMYPEYSDAASKALLHLNKEWQEHDEEIGKKQRPELEHAQWLSYHRKSIVGSSVAGTAHTSGNSTDDDDKQAGKKDKPTAGVFSRLFRRRSIHHQPVTEKPKKKKTEDFEGEGEGQGNGTDNAQRSMSV